MDDSIKQKALRQLARIGGDVPMAALNKEADKIAAVLQTETNYQLIKDQLELIDTIAYRVHEKAIDMLSSLLDRLKTLTLTYPEIPGYSAEEMSRYQNNDSLTIEVLKILEHFRYHQPDKILDIFFKYITHKNETVMKQAEHGLGTIAGYDLDIFYSDGKDFPGLGWEPQEKVIAKINSFNDEDKKSYYFGIIKACEDILSPTISGSKWSYQNVTMQTGAVPAKQGIKDVRNQALSILENLYSLVDTIDKKRAVITGMHSATQTPHAGKYGDDVLEMVMENTITVLDFTIRVVANEDLEIVQKIEHDAYFFYFRGVSKEVKTKALEVKALIDANEEYKIFKMLIGFEGIYGEWSENEQEFDLKYDKEKALREGKVQEFVQQITEDNYQKWKERIIYYSQIKSNDLATFPYFGKFLEVFGRTSPALALKLISESHAQIKNFLTTLIFGIWETDKKNDIRAIMLGWIDNNKYLFAIVRLLEFTKDLDEDLLKRTYEAAKKHNDLLTINQVISTISSQYKENTKHLVTDMLLPAIEFLTQHKNFGWIFGFWFRKNRGEILGGLELKAYKIILDNLFLSPRIDYQAEEILGKIAENSPELVIKFFCDRINAERPGDIYERYETIPFNFYKLSEPLSKIPNQATDIVYQSYDGNYGMFIYRGAKLLSNIFPSFPKSFQDKLNQYIQTKEEKNILFVFAVLRNYEGKEIIRDFCKEIVKVLPADGSLNNELETILQSTGVVNGEYGFLEAYKAKIEQIKPWLNDQNDKVKLFAQKYISDLEKQIEFEKKRADEGIALRKYEYGEE